MFNSETNFIDDNKKSVDMGIEWVDDIWAKCKWIIVEMVFRCIQQDEL